MKTFLIGALSIFFGAILLGGNCSAAEVMSWQDCVQEATQNHPDLVSAKEKLKQARIDTFISRSSSLPQISAQLSGQRSATTPSGESTTTSSNYSYSISGKQLLFDGFKNSNDTGAAKQTARSLEYAYDVTSSNVRLDLRTAFVELLRAQDLVSITTSIAARRKQNLELVKLRYQAGREHRGSLLTAEADLAQAELEVKEAKRTVFLVQHQLSKALGRKNFIPIEVKGDFQVQPKDKNRTRPDFSALAEKTPFLKELIAKKDALRFGLKSAKANLFPQIYLNGSLGQSSDKWPVRNGEQWSTGVTVSLPLFQGGSRIAEISKAGSALREAQAEERSGLDSVLFSLEQTWTQFQNAIDNISVQQKYLEANEERAKIANAQYSTGLISFDDWIIIEDNLVNSKKSYLDSQANMLIAEATWVQAKGGILGYDN